MQATHRLLLLLAVVCSGAALAERIEIDASGDPNSRLEIRNVVLPGGEEVQLYVIQGSPVTVTIDDQQLIAQHIEVDLSSRIVRVVGFGTFVTPEQTVQGTDLFIELDDESLTGEDVLIVTEAIDVLGAEATRLPGQIHVLEGSFSPCSRCGQEVEDFGFRAERIELYPGDRLVAFGVTVLVRGRPTLELPILVVPLARPDRQPRLAIEQGSAAERAEVALDWPYVAGPDAYGTFSVRYYADVDPSAQGFRPLGGSIRESYLGGGIHHRFYDERGEGSLRLFLEPGFLDLQTREKTRPEYTVVLSYETLDETLDETRDEPVDEQLAAGPPALDFEFVRDDAQRDRIAEYRLELAQTRSDVAGTFRSQGFADLDQADQVMTPSYDNRSTPLRTPVQITLEPAEESFTVGPLLLRSFDIDLGAFQDQSNPTNRSAAMRPLAEAGRLVEHHDLELTATPLWPGLELSGRTDFVGSYYTTGERLIDWDSRLALEQRFGGVGRFGVTFRRDVSEGETPFRFDQIPLRTRTELGGNLQLTPLPWLSLRVQEAYVFRDTRRPEVEGFQPLETELRLFDNLEWLQAVVSNSYDIEEGDPGNLEFQVTLRNPESTPQAVLEIEHLEDLSVRPDRLSGELVDESVTNYSVSYGLSWLRVDARGGYRYEPEEPDDPEEALEYWLPFEAGVTLGTMAHDDAWPGVRVGFERNLNLRRVEELRVEAAATAGPVELEADQAFDLPDGGVARSSFGVRYPGIAELEATGFTLLRPAWLGLPAGEPRTTTYTVTLRDAPLTGSAVWELRYQSRYDPDLALEEGDSGGLRDSRLEAQLELEDEYLGNSRFSVDLFLDLQLRDDRLERSYLRRASLDFAADIEGRVGLQGALAYRGALDPSTLELSRSELRLDEVALTVRALDQLYLGALFDDVWDFTGSSADQQAFDLRPEFYLVWDRCCWALMGAWDSESGAVRISLTTPGSSEGITQAVDTPLVLPGRGGNR